MTLIKRITTSLLVLILWTAFVGFGFMEGYLLRSITSQDTTEAFMAAAKKKIDQEYVGNLAMTLIEEGELSGNHFYSVDTNQKIDEHTVFPVASISKWLCSYGVLKLVEIGDIELDVPIDDYLTRWHLPESSYDNRKVTVRRLLSLTAGLVDDLGYEGFAVGDTLQTIEESLTQASDAQYSEGIARVGIEPGSQYMYSGAGYTILQLLIEEVSGRSFSDYMTAEVFVPLGMVHSSYSVSDRPDLELVDIYTDDGTVRAAKRFTALAAAGLNTSVSDLTKFLSANVSSDGVLKQETITQMSQPKAFINATPVYGLGPHLYSQNDTESNIIGHDGSGGNALNTAARLDLVSGSGIIVLETGNHGMASAIADEWLFWKAGIADYVVMQRNISYLLTMLVIGYICILIALFFVFRRMTR